MRQYSHFFSVLYDEPGPVGNLGRGTHYSVIRALRPRNLGYHYFNMVEIAQDIVKSRDMDRCMDRDRAYRKFFDIYRRIGNSDRELNTKANFRAEFLRLTDFSEEAIDEGIAAIDAQNLPGDFIEDAWAGWMQRHSHYSDEPRIDFHDMAIIWDEDHDTRVITAIELMIRSGLHGYDIRFMGERKGALSIVFGGIYPPFIPMVNKKIKDLANELEDPWTVSVKCLSDADHSIIDAYQPNVSAYLHGIDALWGLGGKSANVIPKENTQ